jgi:hypothetical protein
MFNFFHTIQHKLYSHSRLLVLVGGTFITCIIPISALATAQGFEFWDAKTINVKGQSIQIPAGTLSHNIGGEGNYISKEWASFATVSSSLCNWRVDYVYSDVNKKEKRRIPGRVHYTCNYAAFAETVYPGTVPYGTACAKLYRNGGFVAQQCHSITK